MFSCGPPLVFPDCETGQSVLYFALGDHSKKYRMLLLFLYIKIRSMHSHGFIFNQSFSVRLIGGFLFLLICQFANELNLEAKVESKMHQIDSG